jgi:hypothetical protein
MFISYCEDFAGIEMVLCLRLLSSGLFPQAPASTANSKREEIPESKQVEADELESDLQDYHRKRGVTGQVCLAAFLSEVDPALEGACVPNV